MIIGTWALDLVVATLAHAPLVGDTRSASHSLLRVEIHQGPDGLVQRQELCDTRLEGGTSLARTVLPEGWLRAVPPRTYPVRFTQDGATWHYRADTGVQDVGFIGDPLPTRGTDPNVVDADGDGAPGATVAVVVPGFGRADVWVAQRGHTRLDGTLISPDRIEGRVETVTLTQRTLGASHPLFDFTPSVRPDPARSRFAMWRVADDTDCANLRAIHD